MKKLMFALCILWLGSPAVAQKKAPRKTAPATAKKETKSTPTVPAQAPAVNLTSTSANAAKAGNLGSAPNQLYIADPVIRAFNMRSNGVNIRLSGSGVLGAPRGTYGFANGQISLRTTDAPSIGGITGSGAVGTGTSPGGVGMGGIAPLVNGKSVYAGPSIWGSARNLQLSDSILRRRPGGE